LPGASSRAPRTGLPGISSRRLLAQPCGRCSQRHQPAVRATHLGYHLWHHGGSVAVGAARRPWPSAYHLPSSSVPLPERCPPRGRLLPRSAPWPDQRHAHGPAPRGHGRRFPLARRIITRAALRAFRHLLPTSTCAASRPPLAKAPVHRPRDAPGTSTPSSWRIDFGGRRRGAPSSAQRSPLAFPALLRLAISDPVLIVSGTQHQRVDRPLCPCARPYHGPSHMSADLAVLLDQSSSRRGEGPAPQNGPPRTTSVVTLTPCGTCPRAGPSASIARAARRRRPAAQQKPCGSPFVHPPASGGLLYHSLTGPPAPRSRIPHLGRTAHPTRTRPSRPDHQRPPLRTRPNSPDLGYLAARPLPGASRLLPKTLLSLCCLTAQPVAGSSL
jgi:hypothetical protein